MSPTVSAIVSTINAILAAITAVLGISIPAPTPMDVQDPYGVNQGDELVIDDGGEMLFACTVGYVGNGHLYTSGHCADEGAIVMNADYQKVGTITETPFWGNKTRHNDWAIVTLDPGIHGYNPYSGDTTSNTIERGDTVCVYARQADKTTCGHVTSIDQNEVVVRNNHTAAPGDSGGPVWSPEKGFVGMVNIIWPAGYSATAVPR